MPIKKSELYSSLWSSCDELRGGMDASQYKDYVLVLLFIKYITDKYAGVPYAPIEIPVRASTRATRTARPRHYVRSSWRSRNGSEQAPRRRQVAFRRLHKARRLRLKQSRCRLCRGLPFPMERTALGRPSIGSNRLGGLIISMVYWSARSTLMVTRSRASGCRRWLCRWGPITAGSSIGHSLAEYETAAFRW